MLTRRKFIGTTMVAGSVLATSAQQARPQPTSKSVTMLLSQHSRRENTP